MRKYTKIGYNFLSPSGSSNYEEIMRKSPTPKQDPLSIAKILLNLKKYQNQIFLAHQAVVVRILLFS
ncbi:38970_t:CDS:2 [Gigaspora margarita]|uniref:38970_t:CDS:1 n=1 Tax=Gigaspora margarita TaxID=4874 RepID=A0ABN7UK87_GIGMA|nr:38970_t:CDS:2 [Gigaspora margarita]